MFKIALVGPKPSVNRILKQTEDYKGDVEFLPLPYTEIYEIEEIVKKHEFHVDAWLFSGAVPYEVAMRNVKINKDNIFIPVSDSAFYKAFLELTYEKKTMINRVSIDIIGEHKDLNELLQQSNVVLDECFIKEFDADITPEELFHYHVDLWNKGKTEGALTCLPTVCEQLKKAGVPAAWMTPTPIQIRETLKILMEKLRASYFKETQICTVIIDIINFDTSNGNIKTPYRLQYLELQLKELIIKFCEKVKGTIVEEGNGRYLIFNTRGEVERELVSLQETITHLSLLSTCKVAAGIGFGKNVYSAEENARLANHQSKENGSNKMIIIQDNGEAIEYDENQNELKYSVRTIDESLIYKLKKGNLSVKTFSKIISQIQRMGWTSFTTKDIAIHMNMSERNARRIVTDLHEAELIKCIGEQSQYRGRPTKIYQLR
ncbi:hypothetical protein [Alkalihalobacillus sp. BA299]|uniref:hypothetical protein n=1 Tax=Alkalihalobacillus sp. BA299 TaxID=2815938 RepID=UPI001ADBC4E2|nr:hypothetical protein [Alkalihalobacillus sp. BA299]